jgi:hypothetical protein
MIILLSLMFQMQQIMLLYFMFQMTQNMLLSTKIQMQQICYYCWCSVSPLSFWNATDSHDTLMLSSNLSLFLVLVGGNAVGQ